MPVTITPSSIRGIGPFVSGPGGILIPTFIGAAGTATGCERVRVTSPCSTKAEEVDVQNGQWAISLKNDNDCACGSEVQVDVECIIGSAAGDSLKVSSLPCDSTTTTTGRPTTTTTTPAPCPTITIDPPNVSSTCVNGKRDVTLTCHVTQPSGQTSVLQWDYGDGNQGSAFVVVGPTPAAGVSEPPHAYSPGTYTATLKTVLPQNCPDKTVQVVVPGCTCGQQVQNIVFTEGPCDANGNRQVTATAQPVPGGPAIGSFVWGWDNSPQSQVGGATSPPQTFTGGSTHTVQLAVQTGNCFQQMSMPYTVGPCPTQPTTTTTTTKGPGTSTTTSGPTGTTGTTGPPSGGGGLGCICAILLIIALALIAMSAISFMAWGCSAFISAGLLSTAVSTAIVGIAVLIIWILVCRDCPAILTLINTFTALVAAMPIVAVVLALLGMFGCAGGALACWALFAIILAILLAFARSLGCIRSKGP